MSSRLRLRLQENVPTPAPESKRENYWQLRLRRRDPGLAFIALECFINVAVNGMIYLMLRLSCFKAHCIVCWNVPMPTTLLLQHHMQYHICSIPLTILHFLRWTYAVNFVALHLMCNIALQHCIYILRSKFTFETLSIAFANLHLKLCICNIIFATLQLQHYTCNIEFETWNMSIALLNYIC